MKPEKCSRIIVVCAILHNLSLLWKEPDVPDAVLDEQPPPEQFHGQMDARGVRAHITRTYFI
ncbi:hypothetical protein DPMN_037836 [Dreissena polymorpha]|uniref:DDE Tnp4 domain-containing protein n=1 Tax=Dreissena polymorpha TaxID=45954 RepID=A0A9D4RN61_DREPO|nr:hypothetical protein DPMN_037836 [Dreissena polymorpha]